MVGRVVGYSVLMVELGSDVKLFVIDLSIVSFLVKRELKEEFDELSFNFLVLKVKDLKMKMCK